MQQFIEGLDRARIIKWTAIYMVIYAIVNACGGIVLGIAGGLAAGVGAMTAASGVASGADTTQLVAIGGLSAGLAILYLISVPVFAVAAFGLWRRTSWARMGAVIALGFQRCAVRADAQQRDRRHRLDSDQRFRHLPVLERRRYQAGIIEVNFDL